MTTHRRSLLIVLLVLAVSAADAHHALDLRDATPIRLEGTIAFVSWDGAHVMYRVEAIDARGEPQTWQVLGASPRVLRSRGIAKSTFKVGDRITIAGRFEPHTQMIAPDYFVAADARRYEMGLYPPAMTVK
jgi:hypothetical protein